MATAGNVAIATSVWEERRKKKKRECHRLETAGVAGSSAVNQLKQANKGVSVEAKEEKTAPVKNVEEADDKNPAAEQRVQPNEEKMAPGYTTKNVEEAEDIKTATV